MRAVLAAAAAMSGVFGVQRVDAKTAPTKRPPEPVIRATFGAPTIEGGNAPPAVVRVIRQQHRMLRLCYAKVLHARPDIGGTATLTFEIEPRGAVRNAAASGFDPDVDACLSGVTRMWHFPASATGIAKVTQVMRFASRR